MILSNRAKYWLTVVSLALVMTFAYYYGYYLPILRHMAEQEKQKELERLVP